MLTNPSIYNITHNIRAGKTTLLKRILQSKEPNFKIAIIVNDMGALNLDAEEIKKHKLIQEKQEMVEVSLFAVFFICVVVGGDSLCVESNIFAHI